jgi:hypothetical protein
MESTKCSITDSRLKLWTGGRSNKQEKCVTHVPAHLLPMSPVHTSSRGRLRGGFTLTEPFSNSPSLRGSTDHVGI